MFVVQVYDKTKETLICEIELPPVTIVRPSVSNVVVIVGQPNDEKVRRVTVSADYLGAPEGDSSIKWIVKYSDAEKQRKISQTTRKWVDIDSSFEGVLIGAIYTPITAIGDICGDDVSSEMVLVPAPPVSQPVITPRKIRPNETFTSLTCVVDHTDDCTVEYAWGHEIDGVKHVTDEYTNSHKIVKTDFVHPLFCNVHAVTQDGTSVGDDYFVYVDPPVREMFSPEILQSRIDCVDVSKFTDTFTQGQTLTVHTEHRGPPIDRRIVIWERQIDTDTWKPIIESDTYLVSMSDVSCRLRAVVRVEISHDLLETPALSPVFITPHVLIERSEIIQRFASTMYRVNRATFDATTLVGEFVTVLFKNSTFFIKSKRTSLMRAPAATVQATIIDETASTVAIVAQPGYHTKLTIQEKTMTAKMKFTAGQTRDLFVETLKLFSKK